MKYNPKLVRGFVCVGPEEISWAESYEEIENCICQELEKIEDLDQEDPQIILYTSGTTVFPKGAALSYRKTFFNALNATMDDEGYFYIVDREKDVFISGGENI